ncbi:small GTP-binding protein [Tritrichomonas foetus]|uniref:Small GTP-binding protein n=1 Tax=Tritrichomonas foetus TaxID=1144522 RepID=A0A1J4JG01_9EUKA|nr:small GTP-binding protein [Tritrichomonas foetus]|eukprot:OHS97223.1 small GTP-binding protein [Tritrichomonas foetus]
MADDSLDLKIVFLGAASVGKTSLIHRYCNNRFQEDTINTIGAGFFTHSLKIDDTEFTLLLWDTSGEERFRSVAPSLLRGANGLVLVYDLTNPQSFSDVGIYLEMFLDTVVVDMGCELPVLLLGNKADLDDGTAVTDSTIEEFCEKNRIVLKNKVSAKSGLNVAESIEQLVHTIVTPGRAKDRQPLQLTPVPVNEKSSCC